MIRPTIRRVFYDCALLPGRVAGFAIRRARATPRMLEVTNAPADAAWVPLSMFIAIPTARPGEWLAHNLCSLNSVVPKDQALHGLAF